MSADSVRKLYITLRRSFAGTRETQVRTLQSLGFKYREQTVVQDNTESVRGAILKVALNTSVHTKLYGYGYSQAWHTVSRTGLNHVSGLCACQQVRHLVSVETDQAFEARKAAEAAAHAMRPPIRVLHKAMSS